MGETMNFACMEPVSIDFVIKDEQFIHQIKWDGIRGVANIEESGTTIYTRNGNICTESYPELTSLPRQISAKQAVLDGELTVFEKDTPSFYLSLQRNRTKNKNSIKRLAENFPARYIIFDALYWNGSDLRQMPLEKRQEILKNNFISSSSAALTDDFSDGQALFEMIKNKNMEGIVSKRKGSRYIAGKKHNDWYKTKVRKKILCVVSGISLNGQMPASLVLGVYRGGSLEGIGKVSSGLKQYDLALLKEFMQKYKTGRQKDIVSVKPMLTCWVRFSEWTGGGTLRHPVLLGFCDKEPAEADGQEISI